MKQSASHLFAAATVATVALMGASSQAVACGYYQPGLFEWLAGPQFVRPATCIYQGDRIAEQGPTYSGPAIIHPQPVYQPTVTYPHGLYRPGVAVVGPRETIVRRTTVRRAARVTTRSKGKPEIVRANAEVKIYSPERMEIRLYRR
jgi:hypothetical protein